MPTPEPQLPRSHWLKNMAESPRLATSRARYEAAVIGGGYSGLSAALTLAEAGVETVVIERYYCGYGASGRNAGHLTPTIGKDVPSLLLVYGKQKAKELLHFAEQSVAHTESVIRENDIACDYLNSGNIMAAVTEGQLKRLQNSAAKAKEIGADVAWLDRAEMERRGVPRAFIGGILENKGGTLHSGKYLMALKQLAIERGVTILEGTAVHGFGRKRNLSLDTSAGTIEVNKLVIASNAFKPIHKYLQRKTEPLTVSLIETEVLSPAQKEAIGWTGREGIYTAHEILESYRLTAHNTIVAGSKIITHRRGHKKTGYPGRQDLEIISTAFYRRFPYLNDLKIADHFSGPILFTLDFLPLIRTIDKDISTACAYAGHGVAMATYGGKRAAEMLLGKSPSSNFLIRRRVISLPPEPVLHVLIALIIHVLFLIDKRADRKVLKEGEKG